MFFQSSIVSHAPADYVNSYFNVIYMNQKRSQKMVENSERCQRYSDLWMNASDCRVHKTSNKNHGADVGPVEATWNEKTTLNGQE